MLSIRKRILGAAAILSLACSISHAQGIHFSQYYNAPLLLNPANTALMSESDYRLGLNYRNQWQKIPVPFKTFSGYADLQAFRRQNVTNWLGIGVGVFNDVAGDGNLSLTRGDLSLAYHIQTNEMFMISVGLSGAYASRSVDFNRMTYDVQWDGFKFDRSLANGEQDNIVKTTYYDVAAGVNFAYFPNELVYMKLGLGVAHINQPTETFYNHNNNMGIRPTINLDGQFVLHEMFTLNPSIYYTSQRGASPIIGGTLLFLHLPTADREKAATSVILGGHTRWNESVIGSIGLQWSGLRFMASYDYTMSRLSPETRGNGAIEFGLSFQGVYGERSRSAPNMNCPRF